MTAPLVSTILAVLFVCAGYAAGRVHQWYRSGADREDAYREGYDDATRSTLSMAARIAGPAAAAKLATEAQAVPDRYYASASARPATGRARAAAAAPGAGPAAEKAADLPTPAPDTGLSPAHTGTAIPAPGNGRSPFTDAAAARPSDPATAGTSPATDVVSGFAAAAAPRANTPAATRLSESATTRLSESATTRLGDPATSSTSLARDAASGSADKATPGALNAAGDATSTAASDAYDAPADVEPAPSGGLRIGAGLGRDGGPSLNGGGSPGGQVSAAGTSLSAGTGPKDEIGFSALGKPAVLGLPGEGFPAPTPYSFGDAPRLRSADDDPAAVDSGDAARYAHLRARPAGILPEEGGGTSAAPRTLHPEHDLHAWTPKDAAGRHPDADAAGLGEWGRPDEGATAEREAAGSGAFFEPVEHKAEDLPRVGRRGRHYVPDELVQAATYRLPPDRVARAKVPDTIAPPDDDTEPARNPVPKPRTS